MSRGNPGEPPTRKVNVRLYIEDIEKAKRLYPTTGYNSLVRALLHAHILAAERIYEERLAALSTNLNKFTLSFSDPSNSPNLDLEKEPSDD